MSEAVTAWMNFIAPWIAWLVRRSLPIVGGWLSSVGMSEANYIAVATGILSIIVGFVLMWLHNKKLLTTVPPTTGASK